MNLNIFKIHSNKGTREIALPNCWEYKKQGDIPLTTDQFQKLHTEWDSADLVKLFSILSGIEYKTLSGTHDIILEEQLHDSTRFIYEQPMDFKTAKMPYYLNVCGKEVKLPTLLGSLSIGQNVHVRQAMDKTQVYESLISFVTAIYLQPLIDETDFDYHRAMEIEQEVLKLPISKTYPIAVFFLRKLTGSGRSIGNRLSFQITQLLQAFTKKEQA